MIGHDAAVAEAFASDFRNIAGFSGLPTKWRTLFEDVLTSAVDPHIPGAILPAPMGKGCRIYAVAADQTEWRRLRPLLSAFAGPTLTNFTGVVQAPSSTDPMDAFASSLPAEVIAVAEALDTGVDAMRALRRMLAMIRQAPESSLKPPRPTSWLLSDFEDALNVGDRTRAERLVGRLRDECRLDALNLRFLSVQLLASLESWAELRESDYFIDLCLARKPGAIASHLAETLFQTDLAAAFYTEDIDNCRREYSKIRSLGTPLIAVPPPAALGPGGWRLYAMAALSSENPDPGLLRSLAEGPDLGWISSHLKAPGIEAEVLVAPEPDADFAEIRKALERLTDLPEEQRIRLLEIEPFRSLFAGGAEVQPASIPLGWRDWLKRIPDPDYTIAFEIARKGALEWPIEVAADPVEATALAEDLADALADKVSRARLAQALPLIVNWLQRDALFPRASMRPVYETVLTLFALGEARDQGIMASSGVVGEAILAIGNSVSDYQRLIHSLETLITEGTGTGSVHMLLELIEATIRHPCPDSSAREGFWLTALAVLEPLRHRLEPVQLASLATLGGLLGWSDQPFADAAAAAPSQFGTKLANLRIGIYTLTESAARQAASVLARVAPSVIVQTSSEHVGSAQLKAMAENSDLLIITSLSATHAATDFIRTHRPTSKPICWAAGRGFTSIVRAVEDFIGGDHS